LKKNILLLAFVLIAAYSDISYSQSRPSLQMNIGLAYPGENFSGDLISTNDLGISFISSDFIKNNYATSTGVTLTGTLRFPLAASGIVSATLLGAYTSFNSFTKSSFGTTIENNIVVPVSFENKFSVSTFGLGAEVSPLIGSRIRPFVNANFTFSILSLTLVRNQFSGIIFNDAFRMGLLTDAGINFKLSDEYSVSLSGSYHLSNLFLKKSKAGFEDRIEFNRESVPINDGEGSYYTNLTNPNSSSSLVTGRNKNVNWWSLSLGLNIMLGKSKRK